jgi:hemerythrin-like metal-binding protein
MLTGIAQLDAEHQDLVTVINGIREAEQQGALHDVMRRLAFFKDELAGHFRHEETYLDLLRYPAREAHAKHHAETLTALERMAEELGEGLIELGDIAASCFNELLGTVLIMDMRFLNWHREQKRRAAG